MKKIIMNILSIPLLITMFVGTLLVSFAFAQTEIAWKDSNGIIIWYKMDGNITGSETITEEEWAFQTGNIIDEEYKLFKEKGIVTIELAYGVVKIPTLKSYNIYAEECYNDSFQFNSYKPDAHIWHHKEPTFKGFIEWIENKKIK